MADQNPKLVIEVDADTGNFSVKLGGVNQQLGNAAKTGVSGFSALTEATVLFNQGLELADKLLNGINDGLEAISKAESFDNQKTALTALGKEAGYSGEQIKTLVDTIKLASHGTVTDSDAMKAAFALLNAGVRADTIPTLIEFAERIKDTHPEVQSLTEVVNSFASAINVGSTRSIKQYVEGIKTTSDRTATLNAILEASQGYMKATAGEYEHFGDRMITKGKELKDSFTRELGSIFKDIGLGLFGNDEEKASANLKDMQKELDGINQKLREGGENQKVYFQGLHSGGFVPILQAQKTLTDEINAAQGKLNIAVKEEKTHIEANTAALAGQNQKAKPLLDAQVAEIRVTNQKKMYEQLYAQDLTYFNNADVISKNMIAAEKADIEKHYQLDLKLLQNKYKDKTVFAQKELELEQTKFAKIKAMEDQHTQISRKNFRDGFIEGVNQMQSSYTNFTKFVSNMTVGMGHAMSGAFIQMAKDHKFSMETMLNSFLTFIGESLIQDGTSNLLKGAALSIFGGAGGALMGIGAAEIAAGSALVGSSGGGAASSSGGGGASVGSPASNQLNAPGPGTTTPQKNATIFIQGDFMASNESMNALQSYIRKNSDMTKFAIVPQGVSW